MQNQQNTQSTSAQQKKRGRWWLFAVLAVCAAPMTASYITYYIIKPEGRTNYGTILDPRQYPTPTSLSQPMSLPLPSGETNIADVKVDNKLDSKLDSKQISLETLKGKWLMLQVDSAACATACQKKQYDIRQLRIAQGKSTDRIERVWLTTDSLNVDPKLLVGINGTHIIKADPAILEKWLPVDAGTKIEDHIYLIDPLGNLMMRFPKDADANKIKKDLSKLLKASAIG